MLETRAAITYPWKLILRPHRAWLYDLCADPMEKHSRVSEHPEVVARLEALATEALAAEQAVEAFEKSVASPKLQEQLRALGYLD